MSKTGYGALTNRPGPCVQITKINPTGSLTFIVPFFDETKVTATQKFKQPIKMLYADIEDFLDTSAGDGLGGALVQKGMQLLDLFGTQIFAKNFFAQAWTGEEPMSFSLSLDFFMGMQGRWDSFYEVFLPIMNIMKETVPSSADAKADFISPPAPAPIDVFTTFTAGILGGAVGADITKAENFITSLVSVKNGSVFSTGTSGQSRTWTVDFGYYNGKSDSVIQRFYTIPSNVVESSSFSFSPMVQQSNMTPEVYPIKGNVTLNFKTQTIPTSSDFKDFQG